MDESHGEEDSPVKGNAVRARDSQSPGVETRRLVGMANPDGRPVHRVRRSFAKQAAAYSAWRSAALRSRETIQEDSPVNGTSATMSRLASDVTARLSL